MAAVGAEGTVSWVVLDAPTDETVTTMSAAKGLTWSGSTLVINPDFAGTYSGTATDGVSVVQWSFYAGPPLGNLAEGQYFPRRVPSFREQMAHNVPDDIDAAGVGGNRDGWAREWRRWFAAINWLSSQHINYPDMGAVQDPSLGTWNLAEARGPTLPAGGTYTLIDVAGSGYLAKLFMTINTSDEQCRYFTRVQIYIDGEASPSVDVSLAELCCALGAAGGFYDSNQYTDKFASSSMAFAKGSSFWSKITAPFSSHLRVVLVNASATVAGILGGWAVYYTGTAYNWGKYGKLRSVTVPATAVVPYGVQTLINVVSATGGAFVGAYMHWIGGDGNYNYLEGRMDVYVDNSGAPTHQWDSTEDYMMSGWYFWAGKQLTAMSGCTYKDNSATVAAYRWHDDDPIPFTSSFRMNWKNGEPGTLPTLTNTTVRATLWYYEAAVAMVPGPTTIKGDPGVQGIPGVNAPGSLIVTYPAVSHSPLVYYPGNRTLNDGSGNGRNLSIVTGAARYKQLIAGGPWGFYFDGTWAAKLTSHHTDMDVVGDITIEWVMRVSSLPAATCYIASYAEPGESLETNHLWSVYLNGTGGVGKYTIGLFMEYAAGTNVTNSESTEWFNDNELVHVAIRRSGTTLTLFLNGAIWQTLTISHVAEIGGTATRHLRLGVNESEALTAMNVIVGGLQVIGSALTDAQVLADARSYLGWL